MRRVYEWIREGISVYVADGLAIRLGVHPACIWPDWFDNSPDEAEVLAAETARQKLKSAKIPHRFQEAA